MSFSNELRNELARVMPAKLCCCRAELAALLAVSGSIVKKADGDMLLRIIKRVWQKPYIHDNVRIQGNT